MDNNEEDLYLMVNTLNTEANDRGDDLVNIIYENLTRPWVGFVTNEKYEIYPHEIRAAFGGSAPETLNWMAEIEVPRDVAQTAYQKPILVHLSFFHSQRIGNKDVLRRTNIPVEISCLEETTLSTLVGAYPELINLFNEDNLHFRPNEVIAECGYREKDGTREIALVFTDRKRF